MSSFRRRTPGALSTPPPGTRISAHNSQILTSTGVPSLDTLLGGGLPLHTSLLIREDTFTGYSRLLLSYYVAQGIVAGHAIAFATAEEEPEGFVRGLMGVVEGKVAESDTTGEEEDGGDVEVGAGGVVGVSGRRMGAVREEEDRMRIAWRYQGLKRFDAGFVGGRRETNAQTQFCNVFDLTKRISPALLNAAGQRMALLDVGQWASEAEAADGEDVYDQLLKYLEGLIDEGGFRIRPNHPPPPTILRIALHSIGSPLWSAPRAAPHSLHRFLHSLRALLRSSYATCVLTLPSSTPSCILVPASHLSDAVIHIDSFASSATPVHPGYTALYHGLLDVVKVPRVGVLSGREREVGALGFKVRRKRFLIERVSLPPEVEGVGRGDDEGGKVKRKVANKGGCGSSGGADHLDF